MSKVIEVVVIGAAGSGKSHVLALIDKALRDSYGPHTQIVSRELSMERGLGSFSVQPSADTIFSLKERGLVSGQFATNLKVEIDTADIDASIARVEALQGCASSFLLDPLEQAIESTVRLLREEAASLLPDVKGETMACMVVYGRLVDHLKVLLAEQLSRVAAQ